LNLNIGCSALAPVVVDDGDCYITDDEETDTDNSDDHQEGDDAQEYVDVQIIIHIFI
jgi:hypothetical protein